MQFSAFRRPLLARLLTDVLAPKVDFDEIDTQSVLPEGGRPDIIIDSDSVYALIEVKVERGQGLTNNQPKVYFDTVLKEAERREGWLIFLVPRYWKYHEPLNQALKVLQSAHPVGGVSTKIVEWESVLEIIEEYDLHRLNPFVGQFHELLSSRFRARPIAFSKDEVRMLYSKDFGVALSKLYELFDQIYDRSKTAYKTKREKYMPSLYFRDSQGQDVLWFGMWFDFWKAEGFPLCFGVEETWGTAVRDAFRNSLRRETKSFEVSGERWTLGWLPSDVLSGQHPLDEAWDILAPVIQAVVNARADSGPGN
jgi:hypothetical protein